MANFEIWHLCLTQLNSEKTANHRSGSLNKIRSSNLANAKQQSLIITLNVGYYLYSISCLFSDTPVTQVQWQYKEALTETSILRAYYVMTIGHVELSSVALSAILTQLPGPQS